MVPLPSSTLVMSVDLYDITGVCDAVAAAAAAVADVDVDVAPKLAAVVALDSFLPSTNVVISITECVCISEKAHLARHAHTHSANTNTNTNTKAAN